MFYKKQCSRCNRPSSDAREGIETSEAPPLGPFAPTLGGGAEALIRADFSSSSSESRPEVAVLDAVPMIDDASTGSSYKEKRKEHSVRTVGKGAAAPLLVARCTQATLAEAARVQTSRINSGGGGRVLYGCSCVRRSCGEPAVSALIWRLPTRRTRAYFGRVPTEAVVEPSVSPDEVANKHRMEAFQAGHCVGIRCY